MCAEPLLNHSRPRVGGQIDRGLQASLTPHSAGVWCGANSPAISHMTVGLGMDHNAYMTNHRTILLLACAPVFAQQYTIATIAGDGVAGVNFNYPTSVAVDPAGDLYVADWSGYIRKVWVREGAATIVAGSGILGYGGDGGQATNATIGKAISIALDGAGNIYFADGDNNRIRLVDISTGIVTTVAGTGEAADSGDGGPADQAGVSQPTGITVDAAGDLYFSSSWTRVRRSFLGSHSLSGQSDRGHLPCRLRELSRSHGDSGRRNWDYLRGVRHLPDGNPSH